MKKPLVIVLSLLVLAAAVYIGINTFRLAKKQDSTTKPADTNPTIQLSKDIKSSDAVDAILAYRESGSSDSLPANQKKIIDQINNTAPTINGEPISLTAADSTSDPNSEPTDSIVTVNDANGNPLEPQIAKKLYDMSGGKPIISQNSNTAMVEKSLAATNPTPTVTIEQNDPNPCNVRLLVTMHNGASYTEYRYAIKDEFNFMTVNTTDIINGISQPVVSSVSESVQKQFCKNYLSVTQNYGIRSLFHLTNDKLLKLYGRINVSNDGYTLHYKCGGAAACFRPEYNDILVNEDDISADPVKFNHVLTHELTHAFHGLFCFSDDLWEEGFAEADTVTIDGNYYFNKLPWIEFNNLPFLDYSSYHSYAGGDLAYSYGSTYFRKMYMEDNHFFIKFNDNYYKTFLSLMEDPNKEFSISEAQYVQLLRDVVPNIEGLPSWNWFIGQFIFQYNKSNNVDVSARILSNGQLTNIITANSDSIRISHNGKVNPKIRLSIFDANNNLFGMFNDVISSQDPITDRIDSIISPSSAVNFNNYTGLVKLTISFDGDLSDVRPFYFIKIAAGDKFCQNGSLALAIGGATNGTLSSIASGKSWSVTSKNSLLCMNNGTSNQFSAGKYVLTVVKNKQTFSHQFDVVSKMSYFPIIRTAKDNICPSCGLYTGMTLVDLNNNIFGRTWFTSQSLTSAYKGDHPFPNLPEYLFPLKSETEMLGPSLYMSTGPSAWGLEQYLTYDQIEYGLN